MDKDLKSNSNEFTWPPPDDELDALEQLFISDDSGSLPAPRGTTEVAPPTPVVDEATRLARPGRFGRRRQAAKRLIVTVLPWVAAMAIGALLGERQARINQTERVTHERPASGERGATAAPPVTRVWPGPATQQAPAAAPSPPSTTSSIRPRESPGPATTLRPLATPALASRSRSTREAAGVTREAAATVTTSPAAAAAASTAAGLPDEAASTPTPAPPSTAIDARRFAPATRAAAPVTTADAALDAATLVPAPGAPATAKTPATLATAAAGTSAAPTALAALITPGATGTTATTVTIPRPIAPGDQSAIRRTLQVYEDAYEHLDARAAAAVWPSLDVPALTRAFEGLKAQRLQFDRCNFSVGFSSATAVCSGAAQFVRRVGNPDPLVERRSWTFHLRRAGNDPGADWKIESVSTSR